MLHAKQLCLIYQVDQKKNLIFDSGRKIWSKNREKENFLKK